LQKKPEGFERQSFAACHATWSRRFVIQISFSALIRNKRLAAVKFSAYPAR